MKQMIQKMREDNKGFTLAELLVVVAIIAVLVAIAIPVFTSSLARANADTDAANVRSGYAAATVKVLSAPTTAAEYYLNSDGSVSTTASGSYACKGDAANCDANTSINGQNVQAGALWTAGQHIKYTYTPAPTTGGDGSWVISAAA